MPRIARAIALDYPHHITQRGNNRAQVFFDDEDRKFYITTLGNYARKYSIDIWAYCLMSNHVHLLAVPREEFSLARGIGLTNLVYTQYLNRKLGNSGRVWQNRFFSCPVETETYLWPVVRYIVSNPVKAGIVERVVDYPWSSAAVHITGRNNPIVSADTWLPVEQRHQFAEFLESHSEEENAAIRKATTCGRPLGKDDFVDLLEYNLNALLRSKPRGRPKGSGK